MDVSWCFWMFITSKNYTITTLHEVAKATNITGKPHCECPYLGGMTINLHPSYLDVTCRVYVGFWPIPTCRNAVFQCFFRDRKDLVGGLEPWNFMNFQYFPYIGNVIIKFDFHISQRDWNWQPEKHDANPVFVDGPCFPGQGLDQVVQAGTPKHRSIGMGEELVSEYMDVYPFYGWLGNPPKIEV